MRLTRKLMALYDKSFQLFIVASVLVPKIFAQEAVISESPSVYAVYEAYGYDHYPIVTRGASVGGAISDTSFLELNYAEGEKTVLLSKYQSEGLRIRYKRQLSPSSYINFGLGQKKLVVSYDMEDQFNETIQTAREEHRHLTIESSFGSRWNIKGLMFGCDFFGVSVPVYQMSHKESYSEEITEEERQTRKEDIGFDLGFAHLQVLKVYLGVAY